MTAALIIACVVIVVAGFFWLAIENLKEKFPS